MYEEAKKLHLIEEILKIEDSLVLDEIAIIIKRNKLHAVTSNAKQLKAFAGIWTVEEAKEMKRIIEDSCG
jgi:hypothetical protein